MRLYEYWNGDGIKEIVADEHVDPFEFIRAAKNTFGVEIPLWSVKQKWQSTVLNKKKRHDSQVVYSYPITIGEVK